jgi:predicted Zn-dependent protease
MRIPAFQGLLIPFVLTTMVAGTTAGCATGKIWSFDEESEVEAGATQHALILKRFGAYNDTKISDYVSSIGNKVAATSDRPSLRWQFTVLDSPTPNAFATQGGYVYITRGMLALLQSDAELAAILSHETGHICAQDIPHQQAVGNIMELGVLATIVAVPEFLLFPPLAAAPEGAGMAAISRKDELNADQRGTEFLRRAGFSPETMQTTMELLASMEVYDRDQQKAAGGKQSAWWHRVYASHPTIEKRQEKLAAMTNQPHTETATNPQPDFLAHLNGIEFGSAKVEGIPYNHMRYFAQWRLALEVPEGWLVWMDEKRDQLWLVRPDWKARLQLERITTLDVDNPCKTLANLMAPSSVTELKSVREYGPSSCTGVVHKSIPTLFGGRTQTIRAGVIANSKAAWYGYSFYGYADEKAFIENDAIFLSVAKSTESVQATDGLPKPLSLHIRRAKTGDSFASLARNSRIPGKNTESLLRLLNRRYPDGELQAGELIKIIE